MCLHAVCIQCLGQPQFITTRTYHMTTRKLQPAVSPLRHPPHHITKPPGLKQLQTSHCLNLSSSQKACGFARLAHHCHRWPAPIFIPCAQQSFPPAVDTNGKPAYAWLLLDAWNWRGWFGYPGEIHPSDTPCGKPQRTTSMQKKKKGLQPDQFVTLPSPSPRVLRRIYVGLQRFLGVLHVSSASCSLNPTAGKLAEIKCCWPRRKGRRCQKCHPARLQSIRHQPCSCPASAGAGEESNQANIPATQELRWRRQGCRETQGVK